MFTTNVEAHSTRASVDHAEDTTNNKLIITMLTYIAAIVNLHGVE